MGSSVPCTELGGGPLVAVVSWNQVGRIDLTPVTLPECAFDTFTAKAVVHRMDHPCRDEYDNLLDIPCNMEVFGLEVRCDDASDLSVNDSYV